MIYTERQEEIIISSSSSLVDQSVYNELLLSSRLALTHNTTSILSPGTNTYNFLRTEEEEEEKEEEEEEEEEGEEQT